MQCLVRYEAAEEWLSAKLSDVTPSTAVLHLDVIAEFGAKLNVRTAFISFDANVVYSNNSDKLCVISFEIVESARKQLEGSLQQTKLERLSDTGDKEASESPEHALPIDLQHCFTGDLILDDDASNEPSEGENTAPEQKAPDIRPTLAAPPPVAAPVQVNVDDREVTDASIEISAAEALPSLEHHALTDASLLQLKDREQTFAGSEGSDELFSAMTLSGESELTDALIKSDYFQGVTQSGHDLEVQLRQPSDFFSMPGTENSFVEPPPENLTNGESSLVEPSCLPVFLDDDALVLFQTNEQFLWHYDRHIRNCGLVVEASELSLGSKHNLGLTILGTEIMVRIQAQVCYREGGTVGFMLPNDNEHKSMIRGIVHICRP